MNGEGVYISFFDWREALDEHLTIAFRFVPSHKGVVGVAGGDVQSIVKLGKIGHAANRPAAGNLPSAAVVRGTNDGGYGKGSPQIAVEFGHLPDIIAYSPVLPVVTYAVPGVASVVGYIRTLVVRHGDDESRNP